MLFNTKMPYLLIMFLNIVILLLSNSLPTSSSSDSQIETLYVEACVTGKYLWKEANPTEFYVCLEQWFNDDSYNDDVISGRSRDISGSRGVNNAIRMKCVDGTYMCTVTVQDQKPYFEPCACRFVDAVSSSYAEQSTREEDPALTEDLFSISGFRRYSKQHSPSPQMNTLSLPANGCPDKYRQYPNSHMFGGEVYPPSQTLLDCQRACLQDDDCIGVDWSKLDTLLPGIPGRCFKISPTSARYGALPFSDLCCDHYRKTSCVREPSRRSGEARSGVALDSIDGEKDQGVGVEEDGSTASSKVRGVDVQDVIDPDNVQPDPDSPIEEIIKDELVYVKGDARVAARPIPDTGCPYALKKILDSSHPFGRNITLPGDENNSAEKCKYWCLVRAYCRAVDFNSATNTCYLIRELHPDLVAPTPGVVHYQKTDCPPPLKCWVSALNRLQSVFDSRVTDVATPTVDCQGLCFVRQTAGSNAVIERGCDVTPNIRLGCNVEGTVSTNFETIVCYCDTNRCNGLSIRALVAQMLYLPLDGDTIDHSGLGRNGMLSMNPSLTPSSFTCLDKSVNCSLLLLGDQCVQVPTLGLTAYTALEVLSNGSSGSFSYVPRATFVVYYKRISSPMPTKQGVFGNSPARGTEATWAIFADNSTDTSTAGVITDNTRLRSVEDYKYARTDDDEWHQHVLNYDGQNAPLPTLQYYVDGIEMIGNARLENGNISVRTQPVTVGCVEGLNFIGLVDEARVFSTNLDKLDIRALMAMRDINFW